MEPLIRSTLYKVSRSDDQIVAPDEMKQHLRVDFADDDDAISFLIDALTEALEGELRRALVDQTWDLKLSGFPCGGPWHHHHHHHRSGFSEIILPLPPLVSVDSITYYDDANAVQTLDPANYEVAGAGDRRGQGRIRLVSGASWPTVFDRAEPVIVRFRAGYLTSDSPAVEDVPKDLMQLLKLLVADNYANRESIIAGVTVATTSVPEWLKQRYRVYD